MTTVEIPAPAHQDCPFIVAEPVVYQGRFIRHDYRFESVRFAHALASQINGLVVTCSTPEARYPVDLTVTYLDRVRLTIRDKGTRIIFSAYIPADNKLPFEKRSKFATITVAGHRPIEDIARVVERKILLFAPGELARVDAELKAQEAGHDAFRAMVAQYREMYPGIQIMNPREPGDTTTTVYNSAASGYYLYATLLKDGVLSDIRFSTKTAQQTRDFFSFMSGSTLEMEAALCIWEAMLEARDGTQSSTIKAEMGAVHMRHVAIALAPLACRVWASMNEDEQQSCIPYDWAFIPAFIGALDLRSIIDHGGPRLGGHPEPRAIAETLLKDFNHA